MYCRKFKLLLHFWTVLSLYKTKIHSLLLFPALNSLCSKMFTVLFLISSLSQKLDQVFFLVYLPGWTAGFVPLSHSVFYLKLQAAVIVLNLDSLVT